MSLCSSTRRTGGRTPDEVVVNEVGKDTIKGYLATPKIDDGQKIGFLLSLCSSQSGRRSLTGAGQILCQDPGAAGQFGRRGEIAIVILRRLAIKARARFTESVWLGVSARPSD